MGWRTFQRRKLNSVCEMKEGCFQLSNDWCYSAVPETHSDISVDGCGEREHDAGRRNTYLRRRFGFSEGELHASSYLWSIGAIRTLCSFDSCCLRAGLQEDRHLPGRHGSLL